MARTIAIALFAFSVWVVVAEAQGLSTGMERYLLSPAEKQTLANDALDGSKTAAVRLARSFTIAPDGKNSAPYWAQIGAENGDDEAQYMYGSILLRGANHSIEDRRRALFWLRASAQQGNKSAQLKLAKEGQ